MENLPDHYESYITLTDLSGNETTYYSSVYEGLPDEIEDLAKKKLNEKEELKTEGLQALKEYLERNHMTPLEDHLLLTVLRMCSYDVRKAEARVKTFHDTRQKIIRMLVDLEIATIENIIDDLFFGVLPYRDKDGGAIVFVREGNVNLDRYSSHDVGVTGMAFGLFLMKFPLSTTTRFSGIADSKGVSRYLKPILKELSKFLFIGLAFPIRIARIEVFNESLLCYFFVKMAQPFVDSRIIRRIYWHGSHFEDLKCFYDPDILPKEFGGNMGPLNNAHYRQKFLDFVQELKRENTLPEI